MDDDKESTGGLDMDTLHSLLSNSRRRAVIESLAKYESLDKGELATLVAADEVDKDPDEVESDDRKRVVVSLTQQHLDALEDADVIERERDIVSQGPNFDQIRRGMLPNGGTKTINLTLENATINIKAEIPNFEFD